MSRPSKTPRLKDFEPADIGDELFALVHGHIKYLLGLLDLSSKMPRAPRVSEHCRLQWLMTELVRYAQHGLWATEWTSHEEVRRVTQEVIQVFYARAADGPSHVYRFDGSEKSTRVNIVLWAAEARAALALSPNSVSVSVSVRGLACLAGVDPDHVRLVARQGAFSIKNGYVKAAPARRWLSNRDLEGF